MKDKVFSVLYNTYVCFLVFCIISFPIIYFINSGTYKFSFSYLFLILIVNGFTTFIPFILLNIIYFYRKRRIQFLVLAVIGGVWSIYSLYIWFFLGVALP
jgi:pilus assembly protein TadC